MSYKNDYSKPNLIGIGGVRCGTTWLYNILNNHPEIYMCQYGKELHYFDLLYKKEKDINWYFNLFCSIFG